MYYFRTWIGYIEPFKDFKNKERDAEIDKKVHYLKSVIDDKNNIIDELDKTTGFMKEKMRT